MPAAPHPRFGTDGVRGPALIEISPEFALALGRACARVLGADRLVLARDTRLSGPVLAAAFAAGAAAEGCRVDEYGVLPTPAIARVSATKNVPAAMITASHNPYHDNGIKLFAAGGRKIPDAVQVRIEDELSRVISDPSSSGEPAPIVVRTDGMSGYVGDLLGRFGEGALSGLRLVVDSANGAMSAIAPDALRRLGAEVISLSDAPDGTNINHECGATSPQALCEFVAQLYEVDRGFAFDGDGDRLIAVDGAGKVVDGDRLIALAAVDRFRSGRLAGGVVVATGMANLGFHRAMEAAGIQVVTTPVGDRHVLDAMEDGGFVLGGEQSGHIVHRDMATTGDGLLAAVVTAELVRRSGRSLAELAGESMTSFPQVLLNVEVGRRPDDVAAVLSTEIAAEEARLGSDGRVLVRASGTEALVRVMVEAADADEARAAAERLADAARRLLS
ncbi:MAG: phosphoglucosamine mutase [Ilumatobacteraceae bacterium]